MENSTREARLSGSSAVSQPLGDIWVCRYCGWKSRQSDPDENPKPRYGILTCKVCLTRRGKEKIQETFPDYFKATVPGHIPDQDGYAKVMAWKYGPKGLLLVGTNRKGKSRSAWELVRREIYIGRSVEAVSALRLGELIECYQTGDNPYELLREWSKVKLLLLDDIFKSKLTERVEEQIFTLIDERISNMLPTIITLNDSLAGLASRLSADRGPAIIARILECCETVIFK